MNLNNFDFNFLKYLISFSFKDSFKLVYTFFKNNLFSLNTYFFNFKTGWSNFFPNIINSFKFVFNFIWEQITKFVPFLKIFDKVFNFFKVVLYTIFGSDLKDANGKIIYYGFIKNLLDILNHIPSFLNSDALLETVGVGTGLLSASFLITVGAGALGTYFGGPAGGVAASTITESLSNAAKNVLESGKKSVIFAIKIIMLSISFTFKLVIIVSNLFISFFLKFLDILLVLLKIWFFVLKNVIFILSYIFMFLLVFSYFYCEETTDDSLINHIRKALYGSK